MSLEYVRANDDNNSALVDCKGNKEKLLRATHFVRITYCNKKRDTNTFFITIPILFWNSCL